MVLKEFTFYMPTKVFFGKDIIKEKSHLFLNWGKKALIITGKSSSKKNGSLKDVIEVLDENKISYLIFDEVEENPSLETVERAASIGKNGDVDFIIGIGGGSPIDSAKAIGVLIKNPKASIEDLFGEIEMSSVPLIAVPTTAGTGTEVTPYGVFTDHKLKTKLSFTQRVFPEIALLDAKYLQFMPYNVTINTAIDALSHLMEGYLGTKANILSDVSAEKGFKLFGECINALERKEITYEVFEKLFLMSTLGGIVIAQTGTSLPHGMGYALTYFHGFPHGLANGLLLKAYLEFCQDKEKVNTMLTLLGIKTMDQFGSYIEKLINKEKIVLEEDIINYTKVFISNKGKLKNHPYKVEEEDILNIYKKSLL